MYFLDYETQLVNEKLFCASFESFDNITKLLTDVNGNMELNKNVNLGIGTTVQFLD